MWMRIWRGGWMTLSAVGILVILWILLQPPVRVAANPTGETAQHAVPESPVRVVEYGRLELAAGTPFLRKLEVVEISLSRVTHPLLTVTGSVIARVRLGDEDIMDRWQFSSSELSSLYAEWLNAKSEVEFSERQLAKTEELFTTQNDYLAKIVGRLEGIIASGSLPERELMAAKADLLKAQLQGQKDIFSAKSEIRIAARSRERLERELSHFGIEPTVFERTAENMVLLAANVPEVDLSIVKERQECEAQIYGLQDAMFTGHVESLGSVLASDRRVLRALFHIDDPSGRLLPGMFAEIGLGTEDRDVLLLPVSSLLRIKTEDYVAIADDEQHLSIAKVRVGPRHDDHFEVLEGLRPGQKVVADGAVLLLPLAAKSLRNTSLN